MASSCLFGCFYVFLRCRDAGGTVHISSAIFGGFILLCFTFVVVCRLCLCDELYKVTSVLCSVTVWNHTAAVIGILIALRQLKIQRFADHIFNCLRLYCTFYSLFKYFSCRCVETYFGHDTYFLLYLGSKLLLCTT